MISTNKFLHYFDWITFGLCILLNIIGILFVYSATYTESVPYSIFFKKQLLGTLFIIAVHFVVTQIEYHWLMRWCYLSYPLLIAILSSTLLIGSMVLGGQRWMSLGIFKMQPSELAKLWLPGFTAYWLYTEKEHTQSALRYFFVPLLNTLVCALLVCKQPDLGTAIVLILSGLPLLLMAGLPLRTYFYGACIAILCIPIGWKTLKPYQQKRIVVFLGQGEKKKERYQIEQATIAIGLGKLTGTGFLKGTQNKLRFLPEGRTDFIFAVLCEEWGFIGALMVLLLFLLLFLRILYLISTIVDPSIQILCLGLFMPLMLSAIINLFMVNNMLPIVGIPLPFMSYGLTNLWVSWLCIAWIQGVCMQRSHIGEYKLELQPRYQL